MVGAEDGIRPVKDDYGMDETRDELKLHLQALEEFEPPYRAYVAGQKRDDGGWAEAEMEARKSQLLELGPAVDEALMAAGVGMPALAHPRAIGGGLMAQGVTSLMFNHGPVGLDESGFAMQTLILEKVVAAKGALKMRLKRRPKSALARALPSSGVKRTGNFDAWREVGSRQRARDEERRVREEEESSGWKRAGRWLIGEAWKFAILVLAAVVAAVIAVHIVGGSDESGSGTSAAETSTTTSHPTVPGAAGLRGNGPQSPP